MEVKYRCDRTMNLCCLFSCVFAVVFVVFLLNLCSFFVGVNFCGVVSCIISDVLAFACCWREFCFILCLGFAYMIND